MAVQPSDRDRRRRLREALLAIDRVSARELVVEDVGSTFDRIEGLVVPTLEEIGLRWEEGSVSLSQVYMASRIAEELVEELLPHGRAVDVDQPPIGFIALEDHHLLGLRIVHSALRASGLDVKNYGQGSLAQAAEHARNDGLRVLLVSVLMLPAALRIRELMTVFSGWESPPAVIAGGAPFRFDERLPGEVGVELVGHSASDAIALVHRALGATP
jgi:methanogenic corrinoid protein MtbC1